MGETCRMCDCCGVDPATWSSRLMLGSDDALCRLCFEGWYEGAILDPKDLAAWSAEQRAITRPDFIPPGSVSDLIRRGFNAQHTPRGADDADA